MNSQPSPPPSHSLTLRGLLGVIAGLAVVFAVFAPLVRVHGLRLVAILLLWVPAGGLLVIGLILGIAAHGWRSIQGGAPRRHRTSFRLRRTLGLLLVGYLLGMVLFLLGSTR